ncbi:MAG: hypothetical protein CSA96_09040, partial [Bacteroidetes bacterium]
EDEKDRQRFWALGAGLSPQYSYRDAVSGNVAAAGANESGFLSYGAGLQLHYHAGKRLAFESGIQYSRMGMQIGSPGIQMLNNRHQDLTAAETGKGSLDMITVANSVGNIVARSGDVYVNAYKLSESANAMVNAQYDAEPNHLGAAIRQEMDYIELPFNVRYTLIDKDIELQLMGGVSANFLIGNRVRMDRGSGYELVGYMNNLRDINYSGNTGLGILYHFHPRFSLMIEPRFRYFLHSVNDKTLPVTRPYSFGLHSGLSFIF